MSGKTDNEEWGEMGDAMSGEDLELRKKQLHGLRALGGMDFGRWDKAVLIAKVVYRKLTPADVESTKDATPPIWVCETVSRLAAGDGFLVCCAQCLLIAYCRGELDPLERGDS